LLAVEATIEREEDRLKLWYESNAGDGQAEGGGEGAKLEVSCLVGA
jgi:hypothetical protein